MYVLHLDFHLVTSRSMTLPKALACTPLCSTSPGFEAHRQATLDPPNQLQVVWKHWEASSDSRWLTMYSLPLLLSSRGSDNRCFSTSTSALMMRSSSLLLLHSPIALTSLSSSPKGRELASFVAAFMLIGDYLGRIKSCGGAIQHRSYACGRRMVTFTTLVPDQAILHPAKPALVPGACTMPRVWGP